MFCPPLLFGVDIVPFIRDALDLVQELGNLYRSSCKFKNLYLNLHADDADSPSPSRLKPIAQHAG